LSPGAVAGIVVAVLLVCVAAVGGVMYYRHRSSRNGKYLSHTDTIVRGKHHLCLYKIGVSLHV